MNQSTKKHVVITGGCGYIGSHIAKALLLTGGYHITIIDRIKREHTLKYCHTFIEADFDSTESYKYLAEHQPQAIIHCAGSLLVGESVVNPGLYYDNNVSKTARFLNQIRFLRDLPVVVFSSSAAVYGTPTSFPINESSSIQPINPYGHSKAMVEQMLTDFDTAYGLKSACLRYFNACGADPYEYELGQAPGATHIIARLLESKMNNVPFTLYGTDFNTPDGTCIRDYIHVWDIAIAHVKAIEYLINTQTSVKLNLGTNVGSSNREVINHVIALAGNVEIVEGPRRAGDPDKLVASNETAANLLNWQPQYSTLPLIVDTAWKWYSQHII